MIKSLNKEINVNELDTMMVELESKIEFSCSGAACAADNNVFCGGKACSAYAGICGGVACFPYI